MKKLSLVAVAALTLAAALASTSDASARAAKCVARSRTSSGWYVAPTLAGARLGALRECAVRTPRGLRCYITSCIWN